MSHLHLRVVEAVGLACTDLTGYSDPYCRVYFNNVSKLSANKEFKTQTIKKTTDPLWNEQHSFNISDKDFTNGSLHIDIFDKEKPGKQDEFLGGALLPLSYFQAQKTFQGWLPVRSSNSARESVQKNHLELEPNPIQVSQSGTSPRVSASQNNKKQGLSHASSQAYKPSHKNNNNNNNNNNSRQQYMRKADTHIGLSTNPQLNHNFRNHRVLPKQQTLDNSGLAFNYSDPRRDIATQIASDAGSKAGKVLPKFGKRDKESGRIFLTIVYQKSYHFGNQSEQDIIAKRAQMLEIIHTQENNFPIRIFTATFNAGNCELVKIKKSFSQWVPPNNKIDLFVIAFQELHTKISKSHSTQNANAAADDMKNEATDSVNDDETDNHYNNNNNNNNNNKQNEMEDELPSTSIPDHAESNIEVIHDSELLMTDEEKMLFELDLNQQKEMEYYFMSYFGSEEYDMIGSYKMWQTRLFIICKKKYLNCISNITKHFHRTGIGGVAKNKGGVAVSFDCDGVSLCFVCSHLAAHQTQTKSRNVMYKKICRNLRVGWPKQQMLGQFHHLFWLGDLNYRVNLNGTKQSDSPSTAAWNQCIAELTAMISGGANDFSNLLKYDQLYIAQRKYEAFVGFQENPINFPPTFKMERETGLNYVKQRLPAWTDRILYRSAVGFQIKSLYYRSHPEVSISDHKPVSAEFVIGNWHRSAGIDDACTQCQIHFRKVSANNLIAADVNGKSDPFIHFPRQILLEKFVAFDKCKKTLNPKWSNSKLKKLPLIRNSIPFLQTSLLLFQIRDWDRFSGNDLIAVGYLPLFPVATNPNNWHEFESFLTLDGLNAGQIQGQFKLFYKTKSK